MTAKFIPPSDAEIDNLAEQMHYYEVVRFLAWKSYLQAQQEMILALQSMRDTEVEP